MAGTRIEHALNEAVTVLSGLSESPRLDAELLLSEALNQTRSYLHAFPEKVMEQQQYQRYQSMIERRSKGEPVAYILGEKEFWALSLQVAPGVLIPRPETELLVELALARIPQDKAMLIADLGTGCGAIALAIASECPQCRIIATDASEPALNIARENAKAHGIQNVELISSDWFHALNDKYFDMIVSNPPYIAPGDPHLQALQHEPVNALISEDEGLRDIAHLIKQAGTHLKTGGWLLLEHGFDQGERIRDLFAINGFSDIETHRDLANLERVTRGRHIA